MAKTKAEKKTAKTDNDQDLEQKKPKLDERWIMEIEGNQFVKFSGLLDLGHQIGISQIDVEPLQLPTKENGNFAIIRATIVSKTGESFTDIGDANPGNCNSKVVKHLLRLASTRAIARSLRTFTNIGMTCLEELADISDVVGNGSHSAGINPKDSKKPDQTPNKKAAAPKKTGKSAGQGKKATISKSAADNTVGTNVKDSKDGNGAVGDGSRNDSRAAGTMPAMSEAQSRAIHNLARRRGISDEDLVQLSIDTYGVDVENLTNGDAAAFIRQLQQAA
jgi:hypothetical protein